jgi:predicted RNA-binding Zn-ribbon protein involved in translation (DUF1610 family)
MRDYSYILPEKAQEHREMYDISTGTVISPQPYPTFPDTCPACGAAVKSRGNAYHNPVTYACGAAYTQKPQIQNHRDVWWGTCPVRKAAIEQKEAAAM